MDLTKDEFLKKLSALLKEYNAEIILEDFGKAYIGDDKMVLQLNSIYDAEGDIIRPFESYTLGTYID